MNRSHGMLTGCAMVLAMLALAALPAQADVLVQIGTSHWADGTKVPTGTFNTAVAGQPAPFNAFTGSDPSGPDFSADWTFTYTIPAGQLITAATFQLGIDDNDAKASANQVGSFTLTGNSVTHDLTADLNVAFEAHGGATGEYDIFSVTIPAADLDALAAGSATFHLALQAPGLGILGETAFNGAGIDFSSLNMQTVPEPATLSLLGLGLAALIARKRK